MKLVTIFTKDEINLILHPMIIVESWRNVMTCESKHKKYHMTFNEKQRAIIKKNYKKYTRWCLGRNGTGIQNNHIMELHEFKLMKCAANFFGTI